jgi:hypothetical protein
MQKQPRIPRMERIAILKQKKTKGNKDSVLLNLEKPTVSLSPFCLIFSVSSYAIWSMPVDQ